MQNSKSLSISVTLMALIRRPDDLQRTFSVTVAENTTIYLFLSDMGYSRDEIRMFQIFITGRDGETKKVARKYQFHDKDELFVTIPIGGG